MVKRKVVNRQQSVTKRNLSQQYVENTQPHPPAQIVHYIEAETAPRQRGRPRKTPIEDVTEKSVGSIIAKALHLTKTHNKSVVTPLNGFFRSIRADGVMGCFVHEGRLVFGIRFKGRKLPQFVNAREVKVRAPTLLIQYYLANIHFPNSTD